MKKIKYPVYQPRLNGNEKKYVNECLDSSWISSKGKFVSLFESSFAGFVNTEYATAVSNGTVALHLALEALGIGNGDEVIVPTLTYIASVNAITYTGATPVFVDALEDTWQIDPEDVKRKITRSTKAILCVHLYGHSCDMDALVEIARANSLFLVEDCAEAIGSKYNDQHVGTFGDVATFSFYGNKTITTGEGGMVTTNNATLHDRLVHLKGQGLAKYREYWHDAIGYNYRMTNICAAIGLAQLENVTKTLSEKRDIANFYEIGFRDTDFKLQIEKEGTIHSYWMCTVLIPENIDRDDLKSYLVEKGIETRPMFYPIHTMPIYSHKFEKHPVSERLARRGLNLPSYPGLSEIDMSEIIEAVTSYNP